MEKKKEYGSPELEKLALEDKDLERVTGGAGEVEEGGESFDHRAGRNRGERVTYCSGSTDHRAPRTYSPDRHEGC